MRVLLDENMHRALVRLLAPEHEAMTVGYRGWKGKKNGELLRAAEAEFDALLTTDQGIPHQQNLSRYALGIVLLEARSNRLADLAPLVPSAKEALRVVRPGEVIRVAV